MHQSTQLGRQSEMVSYALVLIRKHFPHQWFETICTGPRKAPSDYWRTREHTAILRITKQCWACRVRGVSSRRCSWQSLTHHVTPRVLTRSEERGNHCFQRCERGFKRGQRKSEGFERGSCLKRGTVSWVRWLMLVLLLEGVNIAINIYCVSHSISLGVSFLVNVFSYVSSTTWVKFKIYLSGSEFDIGVTQSNCSY